ncbi:IclR family transcriptional regulator [Nocardioides endophyticus]|uniref:IclR family transcriptional regulator n=1 Tax=Nocardioides endophyticus TaxID=1353775 RepID=A0ABP8YCB2_9ACTN
MQSVVRANEVLDGLRAQPPQTPREISLRVGIERTVVYRLLRTLEACGMVIESEGRWRLGAGTLDLAMSYLDSSAFANTAPAFAMDLHRRIAVGHPWLVSLAVPVTDHIVLIDRFWTQDSPLNSMTAIGARIPFDTSATGLAMLARMGRDEGCERIGEDRYAAVEERLDSIRDAGYVALIRDSLGPGVSAIASPVSDRSGTVVGAVNISGLRLEEQLDPASDVAREVGRTATSITGSLQ